MATLAICTHKYAAIPDSTPVVRPARHIASTTDKYPGKRVTEHA